MFLFRRKSKGKNKKEIAASPLDSSGSVPPGEWLGVKNWPPEDRPYIIHAEKLEKIYDAGTMRETKALQGVSLDISLGEIVLVFGPSGSGKSTLLNILAALDKPSGGLIKVAGKDLAKLTYKQQVEYHQFKVGMVFQSYNLVPTITVMQNITMPARLAGFKRSEYHARGLDLLKRFDLEKTKDRLPADVSGGQQQRVAIMRALMNRPAMIIADEPTGNLDSANSELIMRIFKELNEQTTTTMVIVSHDPSLFKIADRVVHILDGKVTKQTILSTKAKVDIKSIDVPVEFRLRPEEKEQLLKELGAKTAERDKKKVLPLEEMAAKAQRERWRAQEEEMVEVKRAALERLKVRARKTAEEHARQWVLAEQEMKTLKTMALERVKIYRRQRRQRWRQEDQEAEQIRTAALDRVRVRRTAEAKRQEEEWLLEEEEMEALKALALERMRRRRESLQHTRVAQWQEEERTMVHLKEQALRRIERRLTKEEHTWPVKEQEMRQLKAAALRRLKRRAKEEERLAREAMRRVRRLYEEEGEKRQSAFARLLARHEELSAAQQHMLAALLVLLSRQQQDALSERQLKRLMEVTTDRVEGALDYMGLYTALDRSEKDGGVGLYRQTAEHIATGLEIFLQLKD